MPCGDDIVTFSGIEDSISHIESNSHNHSPEEEDGCSPFCICQCCGSSIDLPILSLISLKEVINSLQLYNTYTSNYSFEFNGGVWHPPSIS